MRRRDGTFRFRGAATAAALGATLAAPLGGGCGAPSPPRAVLLVTIDTCRADRLGCYGGGVSTPAIDGLAADGTLFLQAGATAPITLPSHLSILTGLYPDRHTVRDNGEGPLPDEAETLAETLHDAGWTTGAFVSAAPLHGSFGVGQGFDRYDDAFLTVPEGGTVMSRLDHDQRIATDVTTLALDWIRGAAAGDAPYFAWVHYFDPHSPYTPPAEFATGDPLADYGGEIAYVDSEIARLLAAVGDGALVVVVADHGESLGEHEELTHGFFTYESALHVPWVLRGPGVPHARRVETPVSLVGVTPTILDLLDVAGPAGLDGTSARALFAADAPDDAAPVYAEALFPRLHFGWAATRSVREGKWKLIDAPEPELYDLAADPDELRNLAADHPDRVDALRADLLEHANRGGALPVADAGGIDPAMKERLEGLGYLGATNAAPSAEEDDLWDGGRRSPRDMIGVFHELERLPQTVMGGTREESDAFVRDLLAEDPGNVELLRSVAKLRLRAGHLDAALRRGREILAIDPDDVDAWRLVANTQLAAGDSAAAIASVRGALERDPADVAGHLRLASLLAARGRTEEAIVAYDAALALSPARREAVLGKASALSNAGRKRAAAAVLRDHVSALPDDIDVRNNLAWLLANERIDPAEALVHARLARKLAPDDAAVLDTFGWAAIRSGHADEAIEPLRRALDATGDAEVRAHLGIALAATGRAAEGTAMLRAAVQERPALRAIPEVAERLP
jgi:arylsulfatase A-like enzyme/Flp pilus assembly protein TadD